MTKLFRSISRIFLAGLLALLPITLTVAAIAWLADLVVDLVGPGTALGALLKRYGWNFGPSETGAYLGGIVFVIALVFLFGLLVESRLKSSWESLSDGILSRIPLIKTVYDASKKLVQIVEPKAGPDMQSMTPVLCRFGERDGTSFPAFLPTSKTITIQGTEYHVVMIPTAPVPFGGAIMCVPKASVTRLDCGIEGLFNIYMSMGTAMPDYLLREPVPRSVETDGNGG